MRGTTAKFLNRCAAARFRQILSEREYTDFQKWRIRNHVRREIKRIWNACPRPQRGALRRQLAHETARITGA